MIYEFANKVHTRLQFGDLLLFFYIIVLVRQYLWGLNVWLAWLLTVPITLAAWAIYVSTKDDRSEPAGLSFWLIVVTPLVFVYLTRVALPDSSFDVWSLRLFHSERALRGYLYWPNEFLPSSAPYNPAPDMLTGIFRHLLGYRLGTVINLLALIWVADVVRRLLRPYVSQYYLHACLVLFVLLSEHLLFEINNYMVDLLALPLMLEATLLTVRLHKPLAERRKLIRIAFLLGASVAFKLTHVVMILPIVAICAWQTLVTRPFHPKRFAATALMTAGAFFVSLAPFMYYVYRETGSPVFPGYNNIFHSPFYPAQTAWDGRWGGYGPWEILAWPVVMIFQPGRLSELGVYSGRLAAGSIAAVLVLLLVRRRKPLNDVSFIVVVGGILWSITMGYIRYALFLEVLSGVLLVMILAIVADKTSHRSRLLRVALLSPIAMVLIVQVAFACMFTFKTEWSLRPTVFEDPTRHAREVNYVLRDRSIRSLLSPLERELFDRVEVWVVSGEKTAGLMTLLNRRAPFINVRTPEYFITQAAREKYDSVLRQFNEKRMYSFTIPDDFGNALFALRYRGLESSTVQAVEIPFYSPSNRVLLYFFEVKRSAVTLAEPKRSRPVAILSADAFRAAITLQNTPLTVRPGQHLRLFFEVRNMSNLTWPSLPGLNDEHSLTFRVRWLETNSDSTSEKDATSTLSYDLAPEEATVIPVMIVAPQSPGEYVLWGDMHQNGAGAFSNLGSQALQLKVSIRPQ